jgi:hypothetical protein
MAQLKEGLSKARDEFYRQFVGLIEANPNKSYARIAEENGLTTWAVRQAVRLGNIKRKRGQGSPAYTRKQL